MNAREMFIKAIAFLLLIFVILWRWEVHDVQHRHVAVKPVFSSVRRNQEISDETTADEQYEMEYGTVRKSIDDKGLRYGNNYGENMDNSEQGGKSNIDNSNKEEKVGWKEGVEETVDRVRKYMEETEAQNGGITRGNVRNEGEDKSKYIESQNISNFKDSGKNNNDNEVIQALSGENAPSLEDAKFGYCQRRRYKTGYPFTAIASVPGSGNTWLRYLIEQITGVYTASQYCDAHLLNGGFLGECLGKFKEGRSKTIACKTHSAKFSSLTYDRGIVLIRNPLKSAAAELQRSHSQSHVVVSKMESISDSKIIGRLKGWRNFNRYWLGFQKPLLIVFYDELKLNLQEQLIRLCQFFEVPCSEKLLDCIVARSKGNFHRPHHDDSHIFKPDHIQRAQRYKQEIMEQLKARMPGIKLNLEI